MSGGNKTLAVPQMDGTDGFIANLSLTQTVAGTSFIVKLVLKVGT